MIASPQSSNKNGRATDSCFTLIGAHQCGVLMVDGWMTGCFCIHPKLNTCGFSRNNKGGYSHHLIIQLIIIYSSQQDLPRLTTNRVCMIEVVVDTAFVILTLCKLHLVAEYHSYLCPRWSWPSATCAGTPLALVQLAL